MPRYQSDLPASRDLVKNLFVNERHLPLEGQQELIEDAYRAPDELLEIASGYDSRKKFLPEAIDRAGRLAIWKTLTDPGNWLRFLSELQAVRIVVRDLDSLKRTVEAEFELLLQDARGAGLTSDKVFIFENVKDLSVKPGRAGLTVRVEVS